MFHRVKNKVSFFILYRTFYIVLLIMYYQIKEWINHDTLNFDFRFPWSW